MRSSAISEPIAPTVAVAVRLCPPSASVASAAPAAGFSCGGPKRAPSHVVRLTSKPPQPPCSTSPLKRRPSSEMMPSSPTGTTRGGAGVSHAVVGASFSARVAPNWPLTQKAPCCVVVG